MLNSLLLQSSTKFNEFALHFNVLPLKFLQISYYGHLKPLDFPLDIQTFFEIL
jgi:hypothetical protein